MPAPEPTSKPARPLPAPFVVGVPRSGTTLLRLMLDAHPDLAVPPETHFIHRLVQTCCDPYWRSVGDQATSECVLDSLTSYPRWADFGLDPGELSRRFGELEPFTLGGALRCFYELYAAEAGKPRWGDKTPEYLVRMKMIQRLLAEARFVHLIRDGRDVWLSLKEVPFGPSSVEVAAELWRERIDRARRQAAKLHYYLEVRYEDLVLDAEPTLQKICTFLELPWNPAMLRYHERASERMAALQDVVDPITGRLIRRGEDRRRHHSLVNSPPQGNRVERWRTELDNRERAEFEAVAGPMLSALGYGVG